jgi:hypothetical protein
MRKNLVLPLAVSLLFSGNAYGQEKAGPRVCADLPGQTSTTHRFRHVGEKIEISLRGDSVPASVADCEPVELKLYWANGRNNGSMFNVTFLDDHNSPIYTRQISAFLTGVLQFPLSSFDARPVYGSSLAMISVPTTVTIQAVPPFAAPASLSYTVTRVARAAKQRDKKEEPEKGEAAEAQIGEESRAGSPAGQPRWGARQGNVIVSIHNAVRLIGASRLPVVQIELKTSRPFPVRDVPLQLQIGKKVFIDELSGDYTGRKLTLSLTPEMFSELKDGDEVVAFFGKPDRNGFAEGDVWHFGKLVKTVGSKQ